MGSCVCKICGYSTGRKSKFLNHIEVNHGLTEGDYIDRINNISDNRCPFCGNPRKIVGWFRARTCGSKDCMRKQHSIDVELQWKDPNTRERHRESRVKYWNSEEGKNKSNLPRGEGYMGLDTFKSFRKMIQNSFVTRHKPFSMTYLYLMECEWGLKVGCTNNLSRRIYDLNPISVLDYCYIPTICAGELEYELQIKYFDSLKSDGNKKTEFVEFSEKQNLIDDFKKIHTHTFSL